MKKITVSLMLVLVFVDLSAASSQYVIPRFIEYSFTIKNTTNHIIEKAEFTAYAPAVQTATQKCTDVSASMPFDTIEDAVGNKSLVFKLKSMPPFSQRIITIKAKLLLSKEPEKYSVKTESMKSYLQPEAYIESNDPHIVQLAKTLQSKKPDDTIENTISWINKNIKYTGYVRNRHGALYALESKSGDCTEFADIFTALCRANGLVSRRISGYVCKENMILKPSEYHDWSEYYYSGKWYIADPQLQPNVLEKHNYIAFRIESSDNKDFDRFKVFPEGIQAEMN